MAKARKNRKGQSGSKQNRSNPAVAGRPAAAPEAVRLAAASVIESSAMESLEQRTMLSVTGFQPAANVGAGAGPRSVVSGDFNNDGKLDLAVANGTGGNVSILLGNGSGSFAAASPATVAVGTGPRGMVAADFNHDGKLDLAVANQGGGISVLLGNNNGTFQSAVNYTDANGPVNLVAADVSGDGVPDLIVANFNSGNVSVFTNNGSGTFGSTPTNYSVGSGPNAVAAADLNGDGRTDLAVANTAGGVSILLQQSDHTFADGGTFAAGTGPKAIVAADFDGDGDKDLVVVNQSSGNVSVLLNDGTGSFASPVNYSVGSSPQAVTVGDFNSDGKLDLAVVNNGGNSLSVLGGNGDGTFGAAVAKSVGTAPTGVVTGDFNSDGALDLAVSNQTTNNVSILTDKSITVTAANHAGTEGASLSATFGSFTDTEAGTVAGDYAASINWGDGNTTAGTVVANGGGFDVTAAHTYAEEGVFDVTVTVTDTRGYHAAASSQATITDAALAATGTTIAPTEGASFTGTLANFTDADPAGAAGDYTAIIDWGDGTGSTGSVASDGSGGFNVNGTHTYHKYATRSVTVTILDAGGSQAVATTTANVADAALSATPVAVSATEGTSFSGKVATFTDANPFGTLSEFSGTIDWNDGSGTSVASIVKNGNHYDVSGTHTYHHDGSYAPTVSLLSTGGQTASATPAATVADAAITVTPATVAPTALSSFTGTLATFTDANSYGATGDFGASINWGDGTTTTGSITLSGGVFSIAGTHTYATAAAVSPAVTITGDGGGAASAVTHPTVNVAQAATTVALGASADITYGDHAAYTATLAYSGTGLSGKSVALIFSQGGSVVRTVNATTDGSGVATYDVTGLGAGTYSVAARFDGSADAVYATSASAPAVLHVAKFTPTISATGATATYDRAAHAATATLTGANGEDLASHVTFTYGGSATVPTNAGTYAVVASYAGDANYNSVSDNTASVVINQASLSVTAADKSKTYGAANPTLTGTLVGALAGDGITASYATVASAASGAGTYAITATLNDPNEELGNYAITNTSGTLTVSKAALTITADAKTRTYGAANPALTATYSGLVNGDTAASLSTPVTLATAAVATDNVGSYAITATGAAAANYNITLVNGSLTVTKAALTVTPADKTKTYGAANPALTGTVSGIQNGDAITANYATVADATSNAGQYNITATLNDPDSHLGNYDVTSAVGTLTVNKAALIITADDQAKTYGAANPSLTASYTGFVNGDTAASLSTPVTLGTIADATSGAGTYAITASGAASGNYTIGYAAGTLTVNKAALTATVNDVAKTYGQANPTFTLGYAGFVNGDTSASLGGTAAFSTAADSHSNVGTYAVTASGQTSNNYAITYAPGTLTVNQAALTITADDQTRAYGSANPTLTASYAGFVNGDTAASLGTPVSLGTAATSSDAVGSYAITASGAAGANYAITFVNGTLHVAKAALTVTVGGATKVYGQANPAFGVTYSGFVNGESAADLGGSVSYSTAADATSPVGSYAVAASGLTSGNYAFTYVDGSLAVTKAALTATVNAASKTYGQANPSFSLAYSGFVNGDTAASLGGAASFSTSASAASHIGAYSVTASGQTSGNYTITYAPGTLTVSRAALTVTADDKTKVYGRANPALTASYAGFVNGEDASVLTAPVTLATAADNSSVVGSYAITPAGATAADYTITFVNGSLAVTKSTPVYTNLNTQTIGYSQAATVMSGKLSDGTLIPTGQVAITVNGVTRNANIQGDGSFATAFDTHALGAGSYVVSYAYVGDANFNAASDTSGLTDQKATAAFSNLTGAHVTYGDATAAVSGKLSVGSLVPTGSVAVTVDGVTQNAAIAGDGTFNTTFNAHLLSAGTHAVTFSYAGDGNFNTASDSSTSSIIVDKAALTVTVNDAAKTYGQANPSFTLAYAGLLNGDTGASLGGSPVFSTSANAASHVGTYGVTVAGITSSNYNLTFVGGTLTVNQAALTATVNAASKTYGQANPTFTLGFTGLVNGDTAASLGGSPAFSTSANAASPAGNYAVTASGLTSGDYAISYAAGTLTVNKAALTITANDATKVYGAANPGLSVSYAGFVNGDDSSALGSAPTLATVATTSSNAGAYAITASGATATNYTISYVAGTMTVTKAALTATVNDASKVYGSANPSFALSYSGFVNGDTSASLGGSAVYATSANAASHVGSYSVSASGLTSGNYTISYAPGTLAVTQAALTATVNNASKVYGSANPSFTLSYAGFVNGDTAASLGGTATFATAATSASHVGSYAVSASGQTSGDYAISYANGTLAVTQAALTVTANDRTKVYGAAVPTLTSSYSGFVNGDTVASLGTFPTLTTAATSSSNAGTYAINASGATAADYSISYVAGTMTVTKAALTATVDDAAKVYGQANPSFSLSYAGFVNGDTSAALGGTAVFTTAATAASHVGGYAVSASGLTSGNYTISYAPGTLAVTQAALTATVNNATKVYGQTNPSFSLSYAGFVNGDTSASLGGAAVFSTAATSASHVGSYAVSASGLTSGDYTISYASGNLAVTQAALTVTANDQTKVYGAAVPTLTASYSGFVNGDTAASLGTQPTLSTATTASSNAGSYAITASGASAADYSITYVAGTMTVTKAALTATVNASTKVYGSADPSFSLSYTGFVNGDTAASLGGTAVYATAADATTHAGSYAVSASGLTSGNYAITYANGTLTITQAALTATVNDASKVYGQANPSFALTYAGLVNGDTAASLGGSPVFTTGATAASHAGSYAVSASGLTSGDYAISYAPGTLTVTQAALTVTANNQTKVYGAAVPMLTASYSGFVNGDTAASLGTQPTLSAGATAASNAGTYAITASGAASADYAITYVAGTMTVTKAALTATVNDASKVYGSANPTFTLGYSGFVNGDTSASLGGTAAFSTAAEATTHVGSYAITASGLTSGNYTISYAPGTLTITQAALTITANDQTKVYGAAVPTLTASYSGFVNGETAASLATLPTLSVGATAGSGVGSYAITASGASDGDYAISYAPGTLSVTPAGLVVTVADATRTYGSANPSFTATYGGLVNGDVAASLGGTIAFHTTAGPTSDAGSYAVTADGLSSGNYTITYQPGTLSVTAAHLVVTAADASRVYGHANPSFTGTITGIANGDPISASYATGATATSTPGTYAITPTLVDPSGLVALGDYDVTTTPATLTVTASTVTASGTTVHATEGSAYSGLVASFSVDNNVAAAGDFTASITWGDGHTTAGNVTSDDQGGFLVSGAHTWAEEDQSLGFHVTITDTKGAGAATADSVAIVGDPAVVAVGGFAVTANEGSTSPAQTVATFVDPGGAETGSGDYAASIDWGDGHSSPGTITFDAESGRFTVKGAHKYAEDGTLVITTTISHDDAPDATAVSGATVADAPLSATGGRTLTATEAVATAGGLTVASFTDTGGPEAVGQYAASIAWGDGSGASVGTIVSDGDGGFLVNAPAHTYAHGGSQTVTVTITHGATTPQVVTDTMHVANATLAVNAADFNATEGTAFSGAVGTFSDSNTTLGAGAFTASINWGDGHTTAGTLTAANGGGFTVGGTHTYVSAGRQTVTVTVTDNVTAASASDTGLANVINTSITATNVAFSATEGTAMVGTKVASFTSANTAALAGDFDALINWGDDTVVTPGEVVPTGNGHFDVLGSHTFAHFGTKNVTVTLNGFGGGTAVAHSTATVADAPITAAGATVAATENTPFSGTVATFADGLPGNSLGEYTAAIHWGDGGVTVGTITLTSPGNYAIAGTHTYAHSGAKVGSVTIVSTGGSTATVPFTPTVANLAITATSARLNAVEGAGFSGRLATFTSANPLASAADFSAAITWGDGTITTGTVTAVTGLGFAVNGTHTYRTGGNVSESVTITGAGGGTATVGGVAHVGTAALTATGTTLKATRGASMTTTVATFTDANPLSVAGDFTASIAWGDGTTSAGTITKSGKVYSVIATHNYTAAATYSATVTVSDVDAQSVTAKASVTVKKPVAAPKPTPGGGRPTPGNGLTAHQKHVRHLNHLHHLAQVSKGRTPSNG